MTRSPTAIGFALMLGSFAASAQTESKLSRNPLKGIAITELARKDVWLDGRRLSYVRILPPVLPPPAPAELAPVAELSEAERAAEERRAAKTYRNILLTGGVYLGDATTPGGTELRLTQRDGDSVREATVFVPLDVRQVDHLTMLETSDTVYVYTVIVAVTELTLISKSEWPEAIAHYASFKGAGTDAEAAPPDYVFEGDAEDAQTFDATLTGIEVLLAHISLHREALAAAYAAREAANAERARQAALLPPPSRDQTIYFWKIETPVAPSSRP